MNDVDLHAVKTYRYLRVAMVALVVGLVASVVYEWAATDLACLQTSISAYYYTPVRGFFVSALVAIGACLLCLKGNTEREDALLNLAGMFAPVVALVPTAGEGGCTSVAAAAVDARPYVENNMTALFVLGLAGLLTATVFALRGRTAGSREDTRPGWAALAVAYAVWAAAVAVFLADRTLFLDKAHYTAAILMFVCIITVVVLNATGLVRRQAAALGAATAPRASTNRYGLIAAAMVLSVLGFAVQKAVGFDHAVLFVEAALILLFALFWVLQTKELWDGGLRPDPSCD